MRCYAAAEGATASGGFAAALRPRTRPTERAVSVEASAPGLGTISLPHENVLLVPFV